MQALAHSRASRSLPGAPRTSHSSSRQQQGSGRARLLVTAATGKGGSKGSKGSKQAAVARQRAREVVVGIDLGTTNSAVAYIEPGGRPKCIPNEEGSKTTPSVVSFLPDGEVAVGSKAKREAARHATHTYLSTKRLIGRKFEDPLVQQELARLPFKVLSGEKGEVCLQCDAVARGFIYPEEVSAQVLVQLLDDAERYTGGQVRKAIISVPAYFNTQQREATTNAGVLAGLDVVRLIREPVAAALAYGLNLKEDQTVLVFDLGGGTYDISLLEVGNGTIEVLSTGGDPHLGGDDWDSVIMEYIIREHLGGRPKRSSGGSEEGPGVSGDGRGRGGQSLMDFADGAVRVNLRALAEAAKLGLSSSEEVTLRMPVGGSGGGPQSVKLTRKRLEELSTDLWRRCRLPLDQACWAAGVDLNAIVVEAAEKREELRKRGVPAWKTETLTPVIKPRSRPPLSKVLLVGGATRMPAVIEFIKNMTGIEPEQGVVNPDEAVALGAAVQAGVLQGEVKDLMIIDQWQASLMRSLAQLQLANNPEALKAMEDQFDMGGEEEEDEEAQRLEAAILAQLDEENAAEEEAAAAAQALAAESRRDQEGGASETGTQRAGTSHASPTQSSGHSAEAGVAPPAQSSGQSSSEERASPTQSCGQSAEAGVTPPEPAAAGAGLSRATGSESQGVGEDSTGDGASASGRSGVGEGAGAQGESDQGGGAGGLAPQRERRLRKRVALRLGGSSGSGRVRGKSRSRSRSREGSDGSDGEGV